MIDRLTKDGRAATPPATRSGPGAFGRHVKDFAQRLEFGDAPMLLYLASFAREYFWGVGSESLAWFLAACIAACAWCFYVSTRRSSGPTPRAFWPVVVAPLALVYLLRAPFPDTSFDVLNCRLLHSERALRGVLFPPGDFFPSPLPGNPAPDIATGIARHLLGYRLGTVVNLLALVWAGLVVERLLRPFVRGERRRCACVLLALMSEHVLFEVNEYMIDLLALPLVLEALRIVLDARGDPRAGDESAAHQRADAVRAAFLLGTAAALKLTYASAALALAPFYLQTFVVRDRRGAGHAARTLSLSLAAAVAPALPFLVYMYATTGNPVFPLYNAIFKSPYWPPSNYHDPRWGPTVLWEKFAWPVLVAFSPERTTELKVYSGRIALGCIAAIALLLTGRRARASPRANALCVVFLLDALLWSATTGYVRYALELELLGGVLTVALAARAAAATSLPRRARNAAAFVILAVLAAQSSLAASYTLRYEWAMRPTLLSSPREFFIEARLLGRDRSLSDFLSAEERARFMAAGIWVWSGVKTAGLEAVLRPDLPVIGVREGEYFSTDASRAEFARQVAHASGKRIESLCFAEDCEGARAALGDHGFRVVSETELMLPFYSDLNRIRMRLLEVEPVRQ